MHAIPTLFFRMFTGSIGAQWEAPDEEDSWRSEHLCCVLEISLESSRSKTLAMAANLPLDLPPLGQTLLLCTKNDPLIQSSERKFILILRHRSPWFLSRTNYHFNPFYAIVNTLHSGHSGHWSSMGNKNGDVLTVHRAFWAKLHVSWRSCSTLSSAAASHPPLLCERHLPFSLVDKTPKW